MSKIKCIFLTAMLSIAAVAGVNAQQPHLYFYGMYVDNTNTPYEFYEDRLGITNETRISMDKFDPKEPYSTGAIWIYPATESGRTFVPSTNCIIGFIDFYYVEGSDLEIQFIQNEEIVLTVDLSQMDRFQPYTISNTPYVRYQEKAPHPVLPDTWITRNITVDLEPEEIEIRFVEKTPNSVTTTTNSGHGVYYADGTLNIFSDKTIGEITIYNLSGVVVKRFAASGNSFSANLDLPAGVYIVKCGDLVCKVVSYD